MKFVKYSRWVWTCQEAKTNRIGQLPSVPKTYEKLIRPKGEMFKSAIENAKVST